MTRLAIVLLSLMPAQDASPRMADLIGQLDAEGLAERDDAAARILGNWKAWGKEDLALLEQAGTKTDEKGKRAVGLLTRIQVRRKLGAPFVARFPTADVDCVSRSAIKAAGWLLAGLELVRKGELKAPDMARASEAFAQADWDGDALDRLMAQPATELAASTLPLGLILMEHRDPGIRARAIRLISYERFHETPAVLEQQDRESLTKALGRLLADPDSTVQSRAVLALRENGGRPDREHLRTLLRTGENVLRGIALGYWSDVLTREDCRDLVIPFLVGSDMVLALTAIEPLRRYPELAPEVAKRMKEGSPVARSTVAMALGWMGARQYADQMAAMLDEGVDTLQPLVQLGAFQHEPKIAALLTSPRRLGVEWALAWMGSQARADEIAKGLKAADADDRKSAVHALAILHSERHADSVSGLLTDPALEVRKEAARTLGWIGTDAHAKRLAERFGHPIEGPVAQFSAALIKARGFASEGMLEVIEKTAQTQEAVSPGRRATRVALIPFGRVAVKEQIRLLDGAGPIEDGWDPLPEFLTALYEPEAWKVLITPFETDREMRSPEDLKVILKGRGLAIEGEFRLWAPLPKGVKLAPIDLLKRVDEFHWVVRDRKIALLARKQVLHAWKTRLSSLKQD